jgi:hypothetical protein
MNPEIINIVAAIQVFDYSLRLIFDDGQEQIIDFKPFLTRSRHPEIRQWLDPEKFSACRLEYGELVWGNYELCFPVIDLYRNDIEHHQPMKAAA